jgi:hypothetical protein
MRAVLTKQMTSDFWGFDDGEGLDLYFLGPDAVYEAVSKSFRTESITK